MELLLMLYVVAAVLIFLWLTGYGQRPENFPPGPLGVPIFGNIFQIGIFGHKVCVELGKKYGDVLGIQFGSKWAVILNNPEDIREAFSRPEFAHKRGYNPTLDETVEDCNKGIIMSHGRTWVEQRRFTLRTLRDFGFGKRTMEHIIMEEVRELVSRFKAQHCDHPIETAEVFNMAVLNVIWSIVAGQRHEYDDPKLKQLMHLMTEFMQANFKGPRMIFMLFPSLLYLRKIKRRLLGTGGRKFLNSLFEHFRKTVREHAETMEVGNPRDYIDAYLEEVRNTTDPDSSFYSGNSDDDSNLIISLMDLFMAGSETTSSTLEWLFFVLAQHKEVQQKVAQELRSVAGTREILLADRSSLPYTDAMLLELQRFAVIAPMGAPHATSADVNFKGYTIPKNTLVAGNIYASLTSPDLWEEPEKFRPERFLSEDGKSVTRPKAWIPFGVGKRACLGEPLARDEIFLFSANLIQNFEVTMPEDEPPHTFEGHFRIGFVPEPHRIILHLRN